MVSFKTTINLSSLLFYPFFPLDNKLAPDETHVTPSIEVRLLAIDLSTDILINCKRGIHEIEHQITYEGSNFIFHDSQGFESGGRRELEVVWDFIEKRSAAAQLKDQLHAIWYF